MEIEEPTKRINLDEARRRIMDEIYDCLKEPACVLHLQWTPLSRPKRGDPSLLFRQAVLAPTPYTSAGVR